MLLVISEAKKLLKRFSKKNCKKKPKRVRIEKVIKRKGDKYMLNGKAMIILLIVGLIKKT